MTMTEGVVGVVEQAGYGDLLRQGAGAASLLALAHAVYRQELAAVASEASGVHPYIHPYIPVDPKAPSPPPHSSDVIDTDPHAFVPTPGLVWCGRCSRAEQDLVHHPELVAARSTQPADRDG